MFSKGLLWGKRSKVLEYQNTLMMVLSTMESMLMVENKVLEYYCMLMELNLKDFLRTEKETGLGNLLELTAPFLMDVGKKEVSLKK